MRAFYIVLALTGSLLCGRVDAQKAGVELGVLTCTLEAPAKRAQDGPAPDNQSRDALCVFKPEQGAEET